MAARRGALGYTRASATAVAEDGAAGRGGSPAWQAAGAVGRGDLRARPAGAARVVRTEGEMAWRHTLRWCVLVALWLGACGAPAPAASKPSAAGAQGSGAPASSGQA